MEYVTGGRRFWEVTLVSSQGEMVWSGLNIRGQLERVKGTECHLRGRKVVWATGEHGNAEGPPPPVAGLSPPLPVTGQAKMPELRSMRRLGVRAGVMGPGQVMGV